MDSFLARFKNPLVLLLLVLAQTIWLATQVHPARLHNGFAAEQDTGGVTLLRQWAMDIAGPPERVTHGSSSWFRRLWSNYVDLRHTHEQNADLKKEVARLRLEQAAVIQDAIAGRRLQSLLAFKQRYVTATVAAEVMGASGSDRSHVLWLNKGSEDGLKSEQPVITPDGAVGKLHDVMPHTAQLELINDPSSGVGVILQSTRLRGIMRGTNAGQIQINNLFQDERIKPGEEVITSGGDQIFPRGLPVGTVSAVRADLQHPPFIEIEVQPAANLAKLEDVLVITGTEATLSATAEADQAQAEATARENQRAADLVSARLPGLHASAGDASSTPTGPNDGSGEVKGGRDGASLVDPKNMPAPHVRPPAHADRYSLGATPSAANLTPGGPRP